jgi:hemerythrin
MMSQDDINNLMAGLDNDEQDNAAPSVGEEFNAADDDDFDLDALVNEFSTESEDDSAAQHEISSTDQVNIPDTIDNDFDIEALANSIATEDTLQENSSNAAATDAIPDTIDNDFDIEALANSIATEDTTQESSPNIAAQADIPDTLDNDFDIEALANSIASDPQPEPMQSTPAPASSSQPAAAKPTSDDITTQQIDAGIFPLPVEKDTKVVNQLSQVARDGEEKASQVFDVLSYILDENNEIQNLSKQIEELSTQQLQLLGLLNQKFPNIKQFKDSLEQTQQIVDKTTVLSSKVDEENMKLFEAMELMQFQDIHRQKIERVMSVIKKLSNYLNNLFEDESGTIDNLVVAKHIHGDDEETVDADDLEALISQYSNE